MNLTKLNWPKGWVPSEDPVNGDPNGLLRADNLQQDEDGVLGIVRGLQKVNTSPFTDYVSDIYSKVINNKEILWAGLNINGKQVLRSRNGTFSDSVTVCSGSDRAIFGDCLGQVLVCAGTQRFKDDGTNILPLGLKTPAAPTIGTVSQPLLHLDGAFTQVEGDTPNPQGSAFQGNVDRSTLREVVIASLAGVDTTNIGNGPAASPDNDTFFFMFQPADSTLITDIKVDIILDNSPLTAISNYYSFQWDPGSNPQFINGAGAISIFSAQRGDFTRQGNDTTLDWKHVTAIRYSFSALSYTGATVGNAKFTGGVQGVLNGQYTYIQVNVNDNGVYVAKSEMSPASPPINVINGFCTVTPAPSGDAQVTHNWIFRQTNVTNDPTIPQSFLNDYYLVGKVQVGTPFVDNTSDVSALLTNVKLNRFLQSIQNLGDTIYFMEGLHFERMVYMGLSNIYFSDSVNPDAIDQRYTIKAGGDPTEKNLFIRKVTNTVLVLGTTKNTYEISGDLSSLPDGTLNVSIIPIGEAYPPLSADCAIVNGGLFYLAADGLRVTTGSNSTLVSPQLRLLFQGENRAGIAPVAVISNNNGRYSLGVGKTRLYMTLPFQDGTRQLIVYDLVNKTFRLQFTDPLVVYVTQTDRVLLGYNNTVNPNIAVGDIFELDKGTGFQDQSGAQLSGQPIFFQTVYDANGQPRNRKDTFTLKLISDTGGRPCSIYLDKDNSGNWTLLQTYSSSGLSTTYIPLNNVTLGFRYAIRIVDVSLLFVFRLYEYTIEYEARPEQLDYLRILPTNLGTISRKRVTAFAFVIDTLGNNINFQPFLDNIIWTSSGTVNNATKLTYIFYFTSEAVCTDIGGILSGGVFEFYSINLEECVSEKLPTPVEFLIIPANNYGTPNRKRHTSYKFQILTRGKNVQFTPLLDNVSHASAIFNTTRKTTVEYFFPQSDNDVIGIDIGGTLQSSDTPITPFEFYGVVVPQDVEVLPPRLEYFRIPNNNFGVAARKRLRTLPLVIDTYGSAVTFTPVVDGLLQSNTTTFISSGKTTLYHYFINDVFGTDFGGILQSPSLQPFEFYGLGQPEDVEVLPVPKKYDQLGPIRFDKIGKLFGFRVRLIMNGTTTSMPYQIFGDASPSNPTYATPLFSSSFPVLPQVDEVYEIFFPKNVNTDICRLVLGPCSDSFHRYNVLMKVQLSGMESDSKWETIQ
jgi:hypothetical protein